MSEVTGRGHYVPSVFLIRRHRQEPESGGTYDKHRVTETKEVASIKGVLVRDFIC